MKLLLFLTILLGFENYSFAQCGLAISYSKTDFECSGGATIGAVSSPIFGTITANAQNGIPPYQYKLNNGNFQSSNYFTNLSGGNYTIYVEDVLACIDSISITINEPPHPTFTSSILNNASCFPGCDGSFSIQANGGTPPYQYANSFSQFGPQLQSSNLFSNLCSATYTLLVVDSNGCDAVSSINIPLAASTQLLSTTYYQNPICNGSCGGSFFVNNTSQAIYTAVPYLAPDPFTPGFFENVCAGTYTISATDFNGCVSTTVVTISELPPIQITVAATGPASCYPGCDGYVVIDSLGYNQNITYNFLPNFTPLIQNDTINGFCGSTYTIVATDAFSGCTNTIIVSIAQQNTLIIPNITSIKSPSCADPNSGSFVIQNYNNAQNITYSILPNTNYYVSNDTIKGLSVGLYTITASDAYLCSYSTLVYISPPVIPQINTSTISPTSCSNICNGSVLLSYTNTTPDMYVYKLASFGSPIKIDSINTQTSQFPNLCFGANYFQIVVNNCVSNIVSVIIPTASIPNPETTVTYPCLNQSNGSITVNNPLPNYVYSLNIMPAGSVQSSPGHFENLSQNIYILTALDTVFGCQTTKYINFGNPYIYTAPISKNCLNNSICSAALIVEGFNINYPLTCTFIPNNNISQIDNKTYYGFCKDSSYQINITDSLGCMYTRYQTIYKNQSLGATINKINPTCTMCNGNITCSTNSPFNPITYQLSDSSSTISNQSGNFYNLCSGNYTLTTIDSMGFCTENFISLNSIQASTQTFFDSCFQSCKGIAVVNPIGTIGTYSLNITPNIGTLNGNTFSNLCEGTYTVLISDLSPCTFETQFTIYQNSKLAINAPTITPSVCGLPNGNIRMQANGGQSTYSFQIEPGNHTGYNISNLASNTYTCTVTDKNQCKDSVVVQLDDVKPNFIDTITTVPTSCDKNDGLIWITIPPNLPYNIKFYSLNSIDWSIEPYFEYVDNGFYTIYVKTDDGCIDSSSAFVGFKNNLQLVQLQLETERCNGTNDGKVILPDNGFTYSIEPFYIVDNINRVIPNLPIGTYTLSASDTEGCSGSKIIEIQAVTPLSLNTQIIYKTYGDCHGQIQLTGMGGTHPYTYHATSNYVLAPSDSTNVIDYLCNTTYTITAIDANGCTASQVVFIPFNEIQVDDFSMFPNPANDLLKLIFNRPLDARIIISDAFGQRVIEQNYIEQQKIEIPIAPFADGIYTVEIWFDSQHFYRKLEILHGM